LAFGKVIEYNESPTKTITLTNPGSSAVTLGIDGVAGQFFWANPTTCGSQLAAGASCKVGVYFQPDSTGNFSGTFLITVGGGPTYEGVDVTGTGVLPGTPPGSYTLGVVGTSGMDRHVLNVPLTVQ